MCMPSDALSQHLPLYLGFSYLGGGVSLHGCSSKAQPLCLTLNEGVSPPAALPDLHRGMAPPGPPGPAQPPLLVCEVAPPSCRPWPRMRGSSSRPLSLASDVVQLSAMPSVPALRRHLRLVCWPAAAGRIHQKALPSLY